MKKVVYEEDGVATAVGAIFAILIFLFVLGLFIDNYVPAEMRSFEEQYSLNVENEVMQIGSALSLLSADFTPGQSVSVTFDLHSGYVPLFTDPTLGQLSLISGSNEGYISVGNLTNEATAGGTISVETNSRYFVDESFVYEYSSIFYQQVGGRQPVNSTLQSSLVHVNPPTNGSINLSINLYNFMGGSINSTSQPNLVLSMTSVSMKTLYLYGNFTVTVSPSFSSLLYGVLRSDLSPVVGLVVSYASNGNGMQQILVSSNTLPISLRVTLLTVMVTVEG